jgi:hypothetical protein
MNLSALSLEMKKPSRCFLPSAFTLGMTTSDKLMVPSASLLPNNPLASMPRIFHFYSGGWNITISIFDLEKIQEKFRVVPDCAFPFPEFSVAALAAPVRYRQLSSHERREDMLASEVLFRFAEHASHVALSSAIVTQQVIGVVNDAGPAYLCAPDLWNFGEQ